MNFKIFGSLKLSLLYVKFFNIFYYFIVYIIIYYNILFLKLKVVVINLEIFYYFEDKINRIFKLELC